MSWFKSLFGKKKFNIHEYLEKNPKLKAEIDEDKKKRAEAVDALMESVKADIKKDNEKKKKKKEKKKKKKKKKTKKKTKKEKNKTYESKNSSLIENKNILN